MAAQGAVDGGITDGKPVVALEVPDDTDRPQMVRASEMKDQFDHRRRGRIGVRPSARALVDEPRRLPHAYTRPARGKTGSGGCRSDGKSSGRCRVEQRSRAPASSAGYRAGPRTPSPSFVGDMRVSNKVCNVYNGRLGLCHGDDVTNSISTAYRCTCHSFPSSYLSFAIRCPRALKTLCGRREIVNRRDDHALIRAAGHHRHDCRCHRTTIARRPATRTRGRRTAAPAATRPNAGA